MKRFGRQIAVFTRAVLLGFSILPSAVWGVVTLNPGDTIQDAVNANPAGTTFVLNPGTYYLQEITPKDGDVFQGSSPRTAILSGADVVTPIWNGSYYTASMYLPDGMGQPRQPSFCGSPATWPGCYLPEDLFVNGVAYARVTNLAAVAAGKWYLDYGTCQQYLPPCGANLYMADNPAGNTVEVSAARRAFAGPAVNVRIVDLVVEKYAIPQQMAAIGDQSTAGAGWRIQNCEVRLNHGAGITFGPGMAIVNCFIHDNGQEGIAGSADNVLVQGNEISWNNYALVDGGWEAGGIKLSSASNPVFRGNNIHDNIRSPGLWLDIGVKCALIEGNTISNNDWAGIFHEISYDAIIRDNVLVNNGKGATSTGWLWNSQIMISTSSNADIYNNVVEVGGVAGQNGIGLIQQNRSSQPADCQVTHNNRVHHNVVISDFNNGLTGAVADYNAWGLFTGGNAFYSNYYHMPNLASSRFRYWNGVSGASAGDAYYNWNGWRNNPVNFDLQGGADTTLVPASSVTLPALTNITEVSVGQTTAVITWTSDNPADTQVEYGAGLSAVCAWPAYGSLTPLTDTAVNVAGHCVTLTALGSCTQYHYRVMSRDASGAARVSLDQTFTTGGCPPAPQGQSNGLQVVGMPNPQRGPLFTLGINLSAPADKLMVKLYTSAMLLAADVEVAGPFPRTGWRQISFYAAGLSNGVYFLKAGAESGGQVTEWKTGTLYILR